uniref:Glutamine synthetase n=1 Tax=Myripristis murdjan TaxID=586833 RepID=A0A667WZF2_9TELE
MSAASKSAGLNKTVRQHYLSLAQGAVCLVTYIWIDETGENLKCKTKTLNTEPAGLQDIPEWATAWSTDGRLVEVLLIPVRMFRDPFILDPNKLVLCEVLDSNRVPIVVMCNQRSQCDKIMEEVKEFQPWFGMEQEYTLFDLDGQLIGWLPRESQETQGFNRVVAGRLYGRNICISHCKACLYAGVKICGTNAEAIPGQWEFQVGPCEGTEIGDHLWVARYILHRVCEDFGVIASLDPKPSGVNSGTSGCHTNFSTKEMRGEGGLKHIEESIQRLSKRHSQHLRVYDPHGGQDNIHRLTGLSSTSHFHEFSTATACRDVSVRIPVHVSQKGCGYLEDRRPASNCDPYAVIRALAETCLLSTTEEDEDGSV